MQTSAGLFDSGQQKYRMAGAQNVDHGNQNPPSDLSRGLWGALPMPKKRNTARKAAVPKCAVCADTMKLKRVIPAAHIFPELKTFQCVGCGNLRTVEDERELVASEAVRAAA
jgi:hypothetical protein